MVLKAEYSMILPALYCLVERDVWNDCLGTKKESSELFCPFYFLFILSMFLFIPLFFICTGKNPYNYWKVQYSMKIIKLNSDDLYD